MTFPRKEKVFSNSTALYLDCTCHENQETCAYHVGFEDGYDQAKREVRKRLGL